jgi:putative lipoprotein
MTAAVLFAAPPARADDPDPWFGKDKALHFAASATIAAGGYTIGAAVFDARRDALLLGGGLAALAGVGKEALDLAGYGDPSWKDLAWDGIGTIAGLALAWGLDLAIRGVSDRHPLFVAPQMRAAF